MTTTPSGFNLNNTASWWSRVLGVTLRPWSGTSPVKLLVSSVIQLALCGFFVWLAVGFATNDSIAEYSREIGETGSAAPSIGLISGLIGLAAVAVGVLALLRIAAGVIDLISAREVTGVVVNLGDRRTLDILPWQLARFVLQRGRSDFNDHDRRYRTELVVDTGSGVHQWTIRNQRTVQGVQRGSRIRMRVTPIAGHVSNLEILPR